MHKRKRKKPGRRFFDAKTKEEEYEIIKKIESAFSNGMNQTEAALIAGISDSSLSRYLQARPQFRDKIARLQLTPMVLAKQNIILRIKNGSISDSWRYLESHDKDYMKKDKHEVSFEEPQYTPEDLEAIKVFKEFTKKQRQQKRNENQNSETSNV